MGIILDHFMFWVMTLAQIGNRDGAPFHAVTNWRLNRARQNCRRHEWLSASVSQK
jgi:hypothetical protein